MRWEHIHGRPRRGGFTLIELLVVIAIIGLLIGLIIPAVQKIRENGPRVQCRSDISNIEMGIEAFKSTYSVDYVPSAFVLSNNYMGAPDSVLGNVGVEAKQDSLGYYKKVWTRGSVLFDPANGKFGTGFWADPVAAFPPTTAAPPTHSRDQLLDGNQCLVLFLTGRSRDGFGNQPWPFYVPPGTNGKTFMDIPANRIDSSSGRFLDPWGTPYAYFSPKNGNDYGYTYRSYASYLTDGGYPVATHGFPLTAAEPKGPQSASVTAAVGDPYARPLKDSSGKFLNKAKYQIISAGKNKIFGPGGIWSPGSGGYGSNAAGGDDMSNFATRTLMAE